MALLFSTVNAAVENDDVEFVVGGIPREEDDLLGWKAYDSFAEELENGTKIHVSASAFLYGDGETVNATPEDVDYLIRKMRMDPIFLSDHCDCIEDVSFTFPCETGQDFDIEM